MVETVMRARSDGRVGQIVGAPGTGKTKLGHWLADQLNGVRICAWARMTDKALTQELAAGFAAQGTHIDLNGTNSALKQRVRAACRGQLILIDEANHLTWQNLEGLRFFPDECGAALILCGTDVLERTFLDKRNATYLAQLSRRIGAKRVRLQPFKTAKEVIAYLVLPRFGQVTPKTAKAFLRHSGGYWGTGQELADACERMLRNSDADTLNEDVVDMAASWMAQARRTA